MDYRFFSRPSLDLPLCNSRITDLRDPVGAALNEPVLIKCPLCKATWTPLHVEARKGAFNWVRRTVTSHREQKQEIRRMLSFTKHFPEFRIVYAGMVVDRKLLEKLSKVRQKRKRRSERMR